jgi:hypothetical protein
MPSQVQELERQDKADWEEHLANGDAEEPSAEGDAEDGDDADDPLEGS